MYSNLIAPSSTLFPDIVIRRINVLGPEAIDGIATHFYSRFISHLFQRLNALPDVNLRESRKSAWAESVYPKNSALPSPFILEGSCSTG